jgi:tetratricopeptide (TPR) repeat protein
LVHAADPFGGLPRVLFSCLEKMKLDQHHHLIWQFPQQSGATHITVVAMRPPFALWVLALALICIAGTGCRSAASNKSKAGPDDGARAARGGTPAEKRVRAHAHYASAVIHEMNEEPEAALQDYYQAALCDPENETLILEVSRRFAQKKQPEKALEVLNNSASRSAASGALFAHLGFIYSQLGKYEQAVAANREAIRRAPRSFSGYQNLYLNYLQNKETVQALKVLDEAAKQPGAEIDFLINLSELYANFAVQVPAQKDAAKAKALALLNRAEKLNAPSPVLRLKLADGFNLLGDARKAIQLYLELLQKLPDLPVVRERVRSKLTDLYLRSSDRQGAIDQLEGIIKDDPTNVQAYYTLATVLYEEKKLSEAAELFSKTILLNPNNEQAYYDLASAQLGTDKTSDALATLDRARRRFGQNFVLEFLTAMAFTRQKAYVEAIQHYTAAEIVAQATDPKRLNHLFYFQLGSAYERKGDAVQAEKCFQKSLELSPDFADAMNYLGYMWTERGINLERARELIEKALKLEPNNAAYLDSLGWVLFKLNQPAQALPHILKAAELSPEPDPTLYDHLGDIYAALNQSDKAREAWRKSLSIESNDEVKKKIDSAEKE